MIPALLALACAAAGPTIVAAHASAPVPNGSLSHYVVTIDVKNSGRSKQGSNVLQSVDVYQNGTKVDAKSVPPLAPDQTFAAQYAFDRAAEARPNSTSFLFRLDVHSPASARPCSEANAVYRLLV